MVDIIKDENKVKSNWVKFSKVGDTIQGTLVGIRKVLNQLSGQEQTIYEIKTEANEYWNVGSKAAIDTQMRHVKLGDIVAFKFIDEREPTKAGMNPAKIIQIYHDPKIVDEEWLKEQEEVIMAPSNTNIQAQDTTNSATPTTDPSGGVDVNAVPFVKEGTSNDEKVAKINELAKTKLKVTDEAQIKDKVMEITGMAFLEPNYDKIIEILNKK